MPIRVKKREKESPTSLIYRFNKKVMRSGIVREVRKRQFKSRPINKREEKLLALHRKKKEEEIQKMKEYGLL